MTTAGVTQAYTGAADWYGRRVEARSGLNYAGVLSVNSINNNTMSDTVGPLWSSASKGIRFGVPLGVNWLNTTPCAWAVQQAANFSVCRMGRDAALLSCDSPTDDGDICETGWCAALGVSDAPPATDPLVCSNSPSFAAPAFGGLAFPNAAPYAQFASAVVAVTPDYSAAAPSATQVYNATTAASQAQLAGAIWAGKRDFQDDITLSSVEEGNMTCFAGQPVTAASSATPPYVYGGTGLSSGTWPLAVSPGSLLTAGIQARALRSADTVSFELCKLHQQLMKCHSGDNICNGSAADCCDIFTSTRDACHAFPNDEFSSKCSRFASSSTYSPAFKPWPQYFNVVRGLSSVLGNVACVETDDGQSCVVFNGVTDFGRAVVFDGETFVDTVAGQSPVAGQSESIAPGAAFVYEPNAHRTPAALESRGPVLGVPVKFSLLYSADGSDPATGSYLSQFVSNLNVATAKTSASGSATGTVAATFAAQAGFLALGDFGVRLATALSADAASARAGAGAGTSTATATYAGFASAYFAYALVQRFLLQFYGLAPLAHLAGTSRAVFALFGTDEEWVTGACGVWAKCAPAAATQGAAVNAAAGLAVSGDFLSRARPVVSPGPEPDQVVVTLTVPSLLLAWSPSALLQAMFPTTLMASASGSSAGSFIVPGAPSSTAAFSTSAAYTTIVAGLAPASGSAPAPASASASTPASGAAFAGDASLFPLAKTVSDDDAGTDMDGALDEYLDEYFAVSTDSTLAQGAVPYSTGAAPPAPGSATEAVVGVRRTFTVSTAQAKSVTLLFYLYCLKTAALTLDPACIADAAVSLVPTTVDGTNACTLALACLQTGFDGTGASAVNALFVTGDTDLCRCLFPANAASGANVALTGGTGTGSAGAFLNLPAMCFNRYCNVPGIDLASIAATAACTTTAAKSGASTGDASTDDASTGAFTCASLCGQYASVLSASADLDASAIDVAVLRDTCGIDLAQASASLMPKAPVFTAAVVLVALCVPLFVAAYAACVRDPKTQLARAAFWAPATAAFLLCGAAVAYALVDLRGTAWCGPPQYAAGVHWPASLCKSAGFFGLLPSYALPASFCSTSASTGTVSTGDGRTYCACGAGTSRTCSKPCTVCSVDGLCGATNTGTRTLQLRTRDTRFDPLVCGLSGAMVLCVVPACLAAFILRVPSFAGKAAVGVLLCLVLVAACCIPLALQGLVVDFYRTHDVGVQDDPACASL